MVNRFKSLWMLSAILFPQSQKTQIEAYCAEATSRVEVFVDLLFFRAPTDSSSSSSCRVEATSLVSQGSLLRHRNGGRGPRRLEVVARTSISTVPRCL
jgi:hypothetical protein